MIFSCLSPRMSSAATGLVAAARGHAHQDDGEGSGEDVRRPRAPASGASTSIGNIALWRSIAHGSSLSESPRCARPGTRDRALYAFVYICILCRTSAVRGARVWHRTRTTSSWWAGETRGTARRWRPPSAVGGCCCWRRACAASTAATRFYTAGAMRVVHGDVDDVRDLIDDDERLPRTHLPAYTAAEYVTDMERVTNGRNDDELTATLVVRERADAALAQGPRAAVPADVRAPGVPQRLRRLRVLGRARDRQHRWRSGTGRAARGCGRRGRRGGAVRRGRDRAGDRGWPRGRRPVRRLGRRVR